MIVKYFSWVRDLAETPEEVIELPDKVNNIEELIDYLVSINKRYEKIFAKKTIIKIALNKTYVDSSTKINNTDEIAFFPAVTGG